MPLISQLHPVNTAENIVFGIPQLRFIALIGEDLRVTGWRNGKSTFLMFHRQPAMFRIPICPAEKETALCPIRITRICLHENKADFLSFKVRQIHR